MLTVIQALNFGNNENDENDEKHNEALIGCRKEGIYVTPQKRVTNGLLSIMTLSGYYITITQCVHTESPKRVIYLMLSLMTSAVFLQYYCYIQGFGWDIICAIYTHLITLINSELIGSSEILFVCGIMGYFFLDKFHFKNHVFWLCKSMFNPNSSRWNKILNNKNDQIVEQNWVKMNSIISLKRLSHERFNFLLFLIKEWENNKNKKRLESKYKNIWYEPLQNFYQLRNANFNPSETEKKNISKMSEISRSELQTRLIEFHQTLSMNSNNQPTHLPMLQRKSYTLSIKEEKYKNLFKRSEETLPNNPIENFIQDIYELPRFEIQDFIHENLCEHQCLCEHHIKYINELLLLYPEQQMNIDT